MALILDGAVGAGAGAELVDGLAPVAVGQRADGIARDLQRVLAFGGIPAVEDVLGAQRIGMAVVAALLQAQKQVGLSLIDALDGGDFRAGVRAVLVLIEAARIVVIRGRAGRVAPHGRAVGAGVEVTVAVPQQVVADAHAGGIDGERRIGGEGIIASAAIGRLRIERAVDLRRIEPQHRGAEQSLDAIPAPLLIRRAHRRMTSLRPVQTPVRPEGGLVVEMIAPAPRQVDHDVAIRAQVRAADGADLAGPVGVALHRRLPALVEHELSVTDPQHEIVGGGFGIEADAGDQPRAVVGLLDGFDHLRLAGRTVLTDRAAIDFSVHGGGVEIPIRPDGDGGVEFRLTGQAELLEADGILRGRRPAAGGEAHRERQQIGAGGILHAAHAKRVLRARLEHLDGREDDVIARRGRADLRRDRHAVRGADQHDAAIIQGAAIDRMPGIEVGGDEDVRQDVAFAVGRGGAVHHGDAARISRECPAAGGLHDPEPADD